MWTVCAGGHKQEAGADWGGPRGVRLGARKSSPGLSSEEVLAVRMADG